MWEYEVMLKDDYYNNFFIWGYSFKDACDRSHLNSEKLIVLSREYVD